MTKKARIIGILIVVVAAAVLGWFFLGGEDKQAVSQEEPVIVVLDFVDPWIASLRATSTDPYSSELAEDPILSKELRSRLSNVDGRGMLDADLVLCQTKTPDTISARPIFIGEDEAQILVMSPDQGAEAQAVFTLLSLNDGWYIDDIECSLGEVAPESEFSFEVEGFLLKSVPEPLDSQYWHIVFERDGQPGHAVPLFFDSETVCMDPDGEAITCNPDGFEEATSASVKGELLETGVEVKQLKLLE